MAGLRLSMATLAFATVPAVLSCLSIPLGFQADVELGSLVWVLSQSILLPIGLGLALRGLAPAFAERIRPVVGKVGLIGVIAVLPLVLLAFYPALANMDGWSYVVIAAVSVAGLAVGHRLRPAQSRGEDGTCDRMRSPASVAGADHRRREFWR